MTEKCKASSKTMSYIIWLQHTPYISVIQRSIDELLFKINTTKPVSSEHNFKQTRQLQCVHLIMSPAMAALFHWNPASAQRLVRFPLQFNLSYYTNSLKAQLNPWQMQAACDRTLMLRDIIKWTPAYSILSLCSISLQEPITFALTHSSSS
jgi:hypothetical protein